jgi:hypothetical protein
LDWKRRTGGAIVATCVAIVIVLAYLTLPITAKHVNTLLDRTEGMNLTETQEYVVQSWQRFRTKENLTRIGVYGMAIIVSVAALVAYFMHIS